MYNPREIRSHVDDMSLVDLISEHSVLSSVNTWIGYDNNDRFTLSMRRIDLECAIRKHGRELLTIKLGPAAATGSTTAPQFLIEAAAFSLWHAHNLPEPPDTANEEQ